MPRLAVLAYHKIGAPPPGAWETWYSVPEATFRAQLAYLAETGWQPLDVAAFVAGLADPETLPPRSALVTFDDGYATLVRSALPAMREAGWPGAVFVPTGYVGATSAWDANTSEPEEALCTWEELEEVERGGLSVQSHGVSHRTFSALDARGVEEELAGSQAALEERLGREITLFAFPYGDAGDPDVVGPALARAGYRAAFLYGGGTLELPAADRFRLTRVAVGADTDLEAELHASASSRKRPSTLSESK